MLKAVIIDDEPSNIENIKALLAQHCRQVEVVAFAKNAQEGEAIIIQHHPDLVFLDIQMPNKNGFELLQLFSKPTFDVIFVTAYDKYGIQAIKFAALDYLLKPINMDELKTAVNKAIENYQSKNIHQQLKHLMLLLKTQQQKEEHTIALPTVKEIRLVKVNSIIRCESINNYTVFYFTDGNKITVSKPIFEYDDLLNEYGFIRCHQSHLINKKMVQSWMKEDGGYIILNDGTNIPVSRQKKEMVKQAIKAI